MPPPPSARGAATTGVADVIDQVVSGRRGRLWDAIYFGIIYVIPRVKELGAVVAQTSFQVEIWNADELAHLGQAVSITGSSGVSIGSGPTLPAYWAPFSSKLVTVLVDGSGDPVIDTFITWLFPGFTGTDTHVIGFRITIYPESPRDRIVRGKYGYLTDVLRARDASEQRVGLSEVPIHEIAYSGLAPNPVDAGQLIVKLMAGGRFLFAVPYWPDGVKLTSTLSPGGTTIACDTTNRKFRVGELILVWRDARTWEPFTVQAIGPSSITVTSPASGTWPASSSYVMPLLVARPEGVPQLSTPAPGVAEVTATFVTEPT